MFRCFLVLNASVATIHPRQPHALIGELALKFFNNSVLARTSRGARFFVTQNAANAPTASPMFHSTGCRR